MVVPLALMWNLIMLSGMLGGRFHAPWPRRVMTTMQVVLFAAWFATLLFFAVLVARAHTRGEVVAALFVAGGPALLAGSVLTYVEYVVTGRHSDFVHDLVRMRWLGRG